MIKKKDLTKENLIQLGLISKKDLVKVLGRGELKSGIKIEAHKFSKSAILKIKKANRLAMADCSNLDDAKKAILEGADIIGTTLAGYVGKQVKDTDKPNIKLIKEFKKLNCFVMAEGRYNTPELAKQAIQAGADAVTIGSAITRIDNITSWFVKKIKN